jgi:hypothetical protein
MEMRPLSSTRRLTKFFAGSGAAVAVDLAVDDLEGRGSGELEAADRGDVADALVLAVGVVVADPCVEGPLRVAETDQARLGKELLAHGLVEPLDLAGGRRRIRRSEDVADPVVMTDPVEEHHRGLGRTLAGEDLAVVGEDLLGDPVAAQGLDQRITDGLGRRSHHELGADAEPRVIVDPGDHAELGAIREEHLAHHVHLP